MFLQRLAFVAACVNVVQAATTCPEAVLPYVAIPIMTGNQTLCDAYAPSSLTQYQWIIQLINKSFLGDFPPVPANATGFNAYQSTGILDPKGSYVDPCGNTFPINLVPYFNGSLLSTNRNGKPVSRNFLDGGGDEALRDYMPAYNPNSNQYKMMTHFYEYFGVLLGCSDPAFPKYNGDPSQANVHHFMDLTNNEMHYFIHNIFDGALAVGIPAGELSATALGPGYLLGLALGNLFNKRCSPSKVIASYQPAELQSMCMDNATCALSLNATCSDYRGSWGVPPAVAPNPYDSCDLHSRDVEGAGWFSPRPSWFIGSRKM